jgi:formylglycine-generating enzyme required for sulfatase activity
MSNSLNSRNADRLLASIAREPSSGCWLWCGQISNSGYGRMMVRHPSGNKMESAHRASYAAFVAPFRTAQSSGSVAATGRASTRSTSKSSMKGERSKRARARQLVFSVTILWAILLPNASSGTDGNAETRSQDRQLPSRVISAPFSLELVWIPQGRFRMGDITGSGQADERPLREVEISGFWMMRTEVTRGMFARFVEDAGHDTGNRCWVHEGDWSEKDGLDWKAPGFVQSDGHPVTCVSWHDAQAFITWLNYRSGEAFRLPSEAEWE